MAKHFTDAEIDAMLEEVEQAVNTSVKLAKNAGQKPGETDDAPDMGGDPAAAGAPPAAAPGAPGAPGAGAPPTADPTAADAGGDPAAAGQDPGADPAAGGDPAMAGGDPGADPAAEGDPAGGEGDPAAAGQGDQALEGDGQGGEELSDQELHQIYSQMDPADLERHYMVVRSVLRQAYQKFEKSEPNSNKEEEMSKEQLKKFEDEIAALKRSNKEMEDSLSGALKAVEIMAKPTRKAVVGTVEVLGKNEGQGQPDTSNLSKAEIVAKIGEKVKDHSLSKNDRTTMNRYVLSKTEEGRQEVLAILGGKK